MASLARWLVAIVSTLATFGVCLWLFRFISFSWMPHTTTDRWAVAAAFATVAATAVGAATSWWANREGESSEGPVFGSRGDYRGAIFNIESKRGTHVLASPRANTRIRRNTRRIGELRAH